MNTDVLYNINIRKVYSVFTINNERNKAMHRTNRPRWAIIFKYEGETEYKVKGIKYISNAENMMILPKGSSYKWECTKSGRYYAIEFDAEESCSEIFSFPVDNYEKILQLFKETEYKNNLKKPTYKLDIIKNTYTILLFLLQAKRPLYVSFAKRQKSQEEK